MAPQLTKIRSLWLEADLYYIWGFRAAFCLIFPLVLRAATGRADEPGYSWHEEWNSDTHLHMSIHFGTLLSVYVAGFYVGCKYFTVRIPQLPYNRESALRCIEMGIESWVACHHKPMEGIHETDLSEMKRLKEKLARYISQPRKCLFSSYSNSECVFAIFFVLIICYGGFSIGYRLMINHLYPSGEDDPDFWLVLMCLWMITGAFVPGFAFMLAMSRGWYWAIGCQARLVRKEALKAEMDLERKHSGAELAWWIRSLMLTESDKMIIKLPRKEELVPVFPKTYMERGKDLLKEIEV